MINELIHNEAVHRTFTFCLMFVIIGALTSSSVKTVLHLVKLRADSICVEGFMRYGFKPKLLLVPLVAAGPAPLSGLSPITFTFLGFVGP